MAQTTYSVAVIKRGETDGPGITWPRPSTFALIGFGIVVVGIAGYSVTRPGPGGHIQSAVAESGVAARVSSSPAARPNQPASTRSAPTPTPTLTTTPTPTPTLTPTPTATLATSLHVSLPKGAVTVVVFGDSYVAGVGASSTRDAFAEKAVSQLGWSGTYFARADSGYCTSHSVDYLQRLKTLAVKTAPTVFVLEGGINDVGCDAAVLSAQIAASMAQIEAAYPKAALVVLGPVVPNKYSADQLLPVDTALDAAATTARVPYISPLMENWFTSTNRSHYMSADGVNPNQGGYAYLTTLLLRDLEQIFGT